MVDVFIPGPDLLSSVHGSLFEATSWAAHLSYKRHDHNLVWCKVIVWASYQPSKGNRLAWKMLNKNSYLWILAVSFLVPHIEPLLCPLSRKETRLKADHGFLKKNPSIYWLTCHPRRSKARFPTKAFSKSLRCTETSQGCCTVPSAKVHSAVSSMKSEDTSVISTWGWVKNAK